MKKLLKHHNNIIYVLDIVFQANSDSVKIAASDDRIHHPTKIRPNTIIFTDRSLKIYNRIVDNVIGTIQGQGLVPFDEDSWNESSESYAYYPKFKLPGNDSDEFCVVFRLSNTDDLHSNANNELVRGTIRYTIRITLDEEIHQNKATGKYNIIGVNLFRLQSDTIEACDDFKTQVAEN